MADSETTAIEPREHRFPDIRARQVREGWVGVVIAADGPEYVMTEADADFLHYALGRTHRNDQ